MGAEIDRLEVQVEAQATKANNQLDKLIGKLNTLSSSLSNVNSGGLAGLSSSVSKFAQASSQLSNVKTVDFTRLVKNIQSVSSLNTQQIYGAASAMTSMASAMNNLGNVSSSSVQIAQIAKDISKLGGANVQTAITNLPQLAKALRDLMQTLSTAPQVSQNVIQMTNALAKLASQGSKVSTATNALQMNMGNASGAFSTLYQSLKKVSDKITIFGNNVQKADKKTKSFSSTIGSLYQKYFLLTRGINSAWNSIKSSMDYLEVLNYFDAAFGQVADNAVDQWESAGYDSAEAYYNSFSSRAKQLTAKMSGYTLTDNGILEATGMPSLGINPSTLMNYQAMFAQMSSSIGVTSETALKLSDALTMIGADLASVKNMDFDKVWKDMASGLAGMSRTLDKYGVNIRNVNLQQKLFDLGINENIANLNQNEKALLRAIILLDSTKYAWGDLADTLNAPANQLRLLRANFENLARTIGSIFLPVVSKVLPYINGLVIALQRLFGWIAKLLGIDLSGLASTGSSAGDGLGDLVGDVDDLDSSLEDATGSAKKLKNQLQGFDSLNVLTTPQDNGSGNLGSGGLGGLLDDAFLDAFSDYQKAWDEAFSRLENRAQEIADKIEAIAKRLFDPILKAWKSKGKFVMDAWKKAANEIWELIKSIGRDFLKVWEQPETLEILEDIFTIIGNIGYSIGFLAQRFREAWDENDTGLHILENIRDVIGVVVDTFREMTYQTALWASELDFSPLLSKIEEWTASLVPVFENLSGIVSDFYNQVLLPLGKWTIEEGLPKLVDVFIDFNKNVKWDLLRERLSEFWEHLEPFAEKVGEGLIIFIRDISDALANFINSERFDNFLTTIENWMDKVDAGDVADLLEKIAAALVVLKFSVKAWEVLEKPIKIIGSFFSVLKTGGKILGGTKLFAGINSAAASLGGLSGILTTDLGVIFGAGTVAEIGLTIGTGIIGGIAAAFGGFHLGKFIGEKITGDEEAYDSFKWFGDDGFFKIITEDFQTTFDAIEMMMNDFENNPVIATLANIIAGPIVSGYVHIKENSDKIKEEFDSLKSKLSEKWDGVQLWFEENVKPWFTVEKWTELWTNVKETFTEKWNEIQEWWESTAICQWWENDVKPFFSVDSWSELWNNVKKIFSDAWNKIVSWWNESAIGKWFNDNVKPWFTKEKWVYAMSGVKSAFREVWNAAISSVKEIWNKFATWLNSKMKITIPAINIAGQSVFAGATLDLGKIPTFSVGGFPEDGLFMANHGELVGQFSNGRTAVANNEQITEGIAIAVQNANSEQNTLLREQNQLLRAILEKEGITAGDIFRSVQNSADSYYKMTGTKAFA